MHTLDLAPDAVVSGRYRLVEALARGGTASVWRARDLEADRDVAIKVLRDEGVSPDLRARAEREANVLLGLVHPNLVRVLDSGDDGGMPFMVMELLEGDTLGEIVSERGAVPVDEAIRLVADVADGLGAAHAHGLIHRDVKPANIVCHDDVPVLVDFGVARQIDATTLTRGLVVGTAAYLAPEQAQGLSLTPACDVYALGCVLYELLTGEPPFAGDSPVTVALKHVQDDPVPPRDLTEVPAAVDAVVMRCLSKEPARRPANGAALATELRVALADDRGDETVALAPVSDDGTMVMPAIVRDADLIDPSPLPPVPPPSAAATQRPSPARVLAAAAVVAAVVLGITQLAGGDGGGEVPVPNVLDAPVADAITWLEGAGLEADVVRVPSDQEADIVVGTDPAAGDPVAEGGTVQLSVSAGPPATTAPVEPAPDEGKPDKPGRGNGGDKDDD